MLCSMVDMAGKTRENRLRAAAARQGFTLVKSRRRDRLALDWGWFVMQGKRQLAHFRDLDSAERWLRDPASRVEAG
jgi:hypothetical protein